MEVDMIVDWIKCKTNVWCNLQTVKLEHEHFTDLVGVYIIWSGEDVVRIGSGVIKDRLSDHRNNEEITAYSDLKVTWAEIDNQSMQGAEVYLANELNPKVGDRFPNVDPISVNLPWD